MEIIVQLASCRRSLFSDDHSRKYYLEVICQATIQIMSATSAYLRCQDTYTQFCRLLVALKANYQLNDLVKLKSYEMWIDHISRFTINSFMDWENTGHSLHYLITLWARLTMSIPYVRGDVPTFLDSWVPRVCQSFAIGFLIV
jgi:exportin-7